MSFTDKRLRKNAIPFQGKWFSNYVATTTGSQLINQTADGDLGSVIANFGSGQVRIARPMKGDLIEARMLLNAVTGLGGDFRIYIGRFDTDGVTPLTRTEAQKAASWKKMTGFNAPISFGFQDVIFLDNLNLFADIPKRGDSDFNEDAFIVGFDMLGKGGTFTLFDFKVDGSVQMAEVQA